MPRHYQPENVIFITLIFDRIYFLWRFAYIIWKYDLQELFKRIEKKLCFQVEEVLLKWKPTWSRLHRENKGSGVKPYRQKIGLTCSISRDFKSFVAPTGIQFLKKVRKPDAIFFFFLMWIKRSQKQGHNMKALETSFRTFKRSMLFYSCLLKRGQYKWTHPKFHTKLISIWLWYMRQESR